MKKILSSKYKFLILGLFVVATIVSIVFSFKVKVNYDLTKYLPEDSNSKQALKILDEEFGDYASIELMVENVDNDKAIAIKKELKSVEGVFKVVWSDDIAAFASFITDPHVLEQVSQLQETFYKENNALFTILLESDSYSLDSEKTINKLRSLTILKEEKVSLRGETLYNIDSRKIANGEVLKIMLVIIPVIILILLVFAKSWIEPVIILLNLGVAIALNTGTNVLLGGVSFITQTMAMALQLAISLDYSLFLIHRYYEEKQQNHSSLEAITIALKATFSSILGSALTTIVGFASLLFMQYKIGNDVGLVMGKGVIFSFLTTMFLMPILILLFSNILDKSMKKKNFNFNVDKPARVFYKKRYITIAVFVVLAVVGIIFQNKIDFLYGSGQYSNDESAVVKEESAINEVFGVNKPVVIFVPNGDNVKEGLLVQSLESNDHVLSIKSISTYESMLGISRKFLPDAIKNEFVGENYTRIIINTDIEEESESMYVFSDDLKEAVENLYDTYYLAGLATSTTEIKNVTTSDSLLVTLVSIVGVGLVILFALKSASLPIILLLVIQSSIWINLSITYFKGSSIVFIGYLVIQTLQLGATIDYAVLLSSRYKEFRVKMSSIDAISNALKSSGISIVISATVLAVAGYAEGILSNISIINEIGLLIGRGALISGLLVIFVLPSFLVLFDKLIMKTTYKPNFYIEAPKENK